jgi:mitochondrial intermembrane space import and assembly protein 40
MQDCFRQHPEMYGAELEDDEDEVEEELHAREAVPAPGDEAPQAAPKTSPEPVKEAPQLTPKSSPEPAKEAPQPTPKPSPEPAKEAAERKEPIPELHRDSSKTTASESQKSGDEGGELLPKASHDATKYI